jgi:hypothetical protein
MSFTFQELAVAARSSTKRCDPLASTQRHSANAAYSLQPREAVELYVRRYLMKRYPFVIVYRELAE